MWTAKVGMKRRKLSNRDVLNPRYAVRILLRADPHRCSGVSDLSRQHVNVAYGENSDRDEIAARLQLIT
jgi:hypothetical protein